jgi:hypothetical protein
MALRLPIAEETPAEVVMAGTLRLPATDPS